jgi:hypothetical protein
MSSPLATQLKAALKAQGFPYELREGPQRLSYGPRASNHIELRRDRTGGDSLGPGKGRNQNPKWLYTRGVGYVLRAIVASTKDGASSWDHECLCDVVIDQLIQAIDTAIRGMGKTWEFLSGRFLTAAELEQIELQTWPGVVYDLTFEMGRSVPQWGFDQAAATELAIGEPGGVTIEQPDIQVTGGTGAATGLPGVTTRIS